MLTKQNFLSAFKAAIKAKNPPWLADDVNDVKLDNFMAVVYKTLTTKSIPWMWNTPLSFETWKSLGGKGKPTLKAMRAMPETESA